ncbi:MAG: hypothetical protein JXX28_14535 [Deltaproteobacteria bacterium]|nr:hypothetical protein [Deltaproteobacteria bacterium]
MTFTLDFPSRTPTPGVDALADWLTQAGEPFDRNGPSTLALRALPLRLLVNAADQTLKAQVEITPEVPVQRLVDLVFFLSVQVGADVELRGLGAVRRATLWLRLADEQDRMRIADAVELAGDRGNEEKVFKDLWQVIASASPGRDVRWDNGRKQIVELLEVGEPEGISLAEAKVIVSHAEEGDVVGVPVAEPLHLLAWRWLSTAYPALVDERGTR